jgi:hypothetical protein
MMPTQKLSAKATETVEFLDYLLRQIDLLASQIEDYAGTKKAATADWIRGQVARELGHLRQRAMVKNLGVIADEVGRLGIQASTSGSQQMKSRVLREGISSLKASVERRRKATVDEDAKDVQAGKDTAAAAKVARAAEDASPAGAGPAE